MRIWFDTEFIEDGRTIDLLSIGLVRADGERYYAECEEADHSKASAWVKTNVLPHLGGVGLVWPRRKIARDLIEFCGPKPEFWAYYADYDWVALCQLFGTMMDLPKGWPMFCRDVKQLSDSLGNPKLPEQSSTEHHAMDDALWTRKAYFALAPAARPAAHQESATQQAQVAFELDAIAGQIESVIYDDHYGKGTLLVSQGDADVLHEAADALRGKATMAGQVPHGVCRADDPNEEAIGDRGFSALANKSTVAAATDPSARGVAPSVSDDRAGTSTPVPAAPSQANILRADYILNHYSRDRRDILVLAREFDRHDAALRHPEPAPGGEQDKALISQLREAVRQLRQTRANMLGTDDERHYWQCHTAADRIETACARIAREGKGS